MGLRTLLSASAVLACATAQDPLKSWDLVLLTDSVKFGARCIDGTPAAIYVKPGIGSDANKFILFWEGGGWCESADDCYGRSKTALGSSKSYAKNTTSWSARDLLLPDCKTNPTFCNWTTVYAPYCDGQSRAGNLADPLMVNGENLYYRGFLNLEASLHAIIGSSEHTPSGLRDQASVLSSYRSSEGGQAMPLLSNATHLLISGSSAGGLTTMLHSDYIYDVVKKANPNIIIKAIPEVGFFIDGASIWNGAHLHTEIYTRVAAFSNVTGGEPHQVNSACVASTSAADRWQCFMAQWTYPHIKTPTFLLNSAWDQWQTENILALNYNISFASSTYPPFEPCIKDPNTGCNATQYSQWYGYGDQWYTAFNASWAATPAAYQ